MSSEEGLDIDEVIPMKDKISIVGRDLTFIPASLGQKFGTTVKNFDFSHNKLTYYFILVF
jgi:hypothetical protein